MFRKPNNLLVLFSILVSCLMAEAAADKQRPFVDEAEPGTNFLGREAWKEADVEIPPTPRDQDLIPFVVDDAENKQFTYAIDERSLRVDEDYVVRYTLVTESRRGTRNYAFEGLRCQTKEYKVYAYGSSKGKLRPRKEPRWKALKEERFGRVHRDLHRYYMCEPTINRPLDRDQIILALKGVVDIRKPDFLDLR